MSEAGLDPAKQPNDVPSVEGLDEEAAAKALKAAEKPKQRGSKKAEAEAEAEAAADAEAK